MNESMVAGIDQLETHRTAIVGHCYWMLGSVVDAEDATQESMLRAWKSIDRFDRRASLKTWHYRIATKLCLDQLSSRGRRVRPFEKGEPSSGTPPIEALVQRPRSHWLEPVEDACVIPADADPTEQIALRQSIRLAFVAALQHLAPKQRAPLSLPEMLGLSAAEVAETLSTSVAAVNTSLQRVRATLAQHRRDAPAELSAQQQALQRRYVAAFEGYDTDELVSLLGEDAVLNMPPFTLWILGPSEINAWLNGFGSGCRSSRLIPTAACGSPAVGQYRVNPKGGHKARALIALELDGDQIGGITSFLDVDTLFPKFDLPLTIP